MPLRKILYPSIDTRSLSLFRIALGLAILVDLIFYKTPYFKLFFSVDAPIDNSFLSQIFPYYKYTFINYLHSNMLVWAVFALTGLSALSLIAGFQTRVASIIAFICIYNLHERNMLFPIGGSDDLLRITLFWSIFLPLNEHYVLYKRSASSSINTICSLAITAFFLQIGFVYFFNAIAKNGNTWQDGTAVQYALMIPHVRGICANWLLAHPHLCLFFTYTMRISSFLILPLIFFPFYKRWCRLAVFLFLLSFHWGVIPFLNVHHFCVSTFPILALLFPIWLLEKRDNTETFLPKASTNHRMANRFILFCLLLILFQNINNITEKFKRTDLALQDNLFDYYGLKQNWNMFAPNPSMENGIIYTLGITPDGKSIDLQTNTPFDQDKEYKRLISEPNLIPLPLIYLNYYAFNFNIETELGKKFWMGWTRYHYSNWQKKYANTDLAAIWVIYLSVRSESPGKYAPLKVQIMARGKI